MVDGGWWVWKVVEQVRRASRARRSFISLPPHEYAWGGRMHALSTHAARQQAREQIVFRALDVQLHDRLGECGVGMASDADARDPAQI